MAFRTMELDCLTLAFISVLSHGNPIRWRWSLTGWGPAISRPLLSTIGFPLALEKSRHSGAQCSASRNSSSQRRCKVSRPSSVNMLWPKWRSKGSWTSMCPSMATAVKVVPSFLQTVPQSGGAPGPPRTLMMGLVGPHRGAPWHMPMNRTPRHILPDRGNDLLGPGACHTHSSAPCQPPGCLGVAGTLWQPQLLHPRAKHQSLQSLRQSLPSNWWPCRAPRTWPWRPLESLQLGGVQKCPLQQAPKAHPKGRFSHKMPHQKLAPLLLSQERTAKPHQARHLVPGQPIASTFTIKLTSLEGTLSGRDQPFGLVQREALCFANPQEVLVSLGAGLLQSFCTSPVQPPQLVKGVQVNHSEVIIIRDRFRLGDLRRHRDPRFCENQGPHNGLDDRDWTQPSHREDVHGRVHQLSRGATKDLGIDHLSEGHVAVPARRKPKQVETGREVLGVNEPYLRLVLLKERQLAQVRK